MTNVAFLEINAVTKRYWPRRILGRQADGVVAVDDVSFQVARGTAVGIVGESGSGKTTLARMMVGLTRPTTGHIRLDGQDVAHMNAASLHRRVQYVFQDPYSSLNPRLTIGQSIEVPLRYLASLRRAERHERVAELLSLTGLRLEIGNRYPHELSGGQRQRVVIARAIAVNPDLVVLDEPVSSLDVSVQAQILALLRSIQEEFGLTYVLISHDLAVVQGMCAEVVVMLGGQIAEVGTRDRVFEQPSHPYTRRLLAAVPGSSLRVSPADRTQPRKPRPSSHSYQRASAQ